MKKITKLSLVAAAAAVQMGDIGGCSIPRFSPYMNDAQVAKERRKNELKQRKNLYNTKIVLYKQDLKC